MPRIPNKPQSNELQVRLHLWRPEEQGPAYEIYREGQWQGLHTLDEARRYAAKRGYAGIRIKPQ